MWLWHESCDFIQGHHFLNIRMKEKKSMNQYKTACNGTINIPQQAKRHLDAHPNVVEHLHAAIGKIHLPILRKKFECEIDMGSIIGRAGVVKTAPIQIGDRAVFALRTNRKLPSRVANVGELGEKTSRIVVVARPSPIGDQYDLVTAWIGTLARKEPWDGSIAERREFQESLSFWSSTALVYDPAIMEPVFESSWKEILSLGKSRFL
jgi:hypothetical protein